MRKMLLSAVVLAMCVGLTVPGEEAQVVKVMDDFEGGADAWKGAGSGGLKASVESTNDAKEGKKAAKMSFTGEKKEGSWVNMAMDVDEWPDAANQLSFWAKAEKAGSLKVAVTESSWPTSEIYVKTIDLGVEWKQYTITLAEFAQTLDWGMEQGDKKLDPTGINKFGFRPVEIPFTFFVDHVQLEQKGGTGEAKKEEKKQGAAHDEDHDHDHADYAKHSDEPAENPAKVQTAAAFPYVVDDFEGPHLKKWRKADSGKTKSVVEFSDDAKVGKKSMKVAFIGEKKEGSWTDLYYDIGTENWPKGGDTLTFWAKAAKECKMRVKIDQGESHEVMEMYMSDELAVGKEWTKISLPVSKITNYLWGHLQPPSGKVVPENVYGIGFMEVDFPVEFLIDQLQIEKSDCGCDELKQGSVLLQDNLVVGQRDMIHRKVDFKGYVESVWMNKKYPFDRSVDEPYIQEVLSVEGKTVKVARTTSRGKDTTDLSMAGVPDDMRWILPGKELQSGESWTVEEKILKKMFPWVEGKGIIRNGIGDLKSASLTGTLKGIRGDEAVAELKGAMKFYYVEGQVTIDTDTPLAGELVFNIPAKRIVSISLKADVEKAKVDGTWDYKTGKGDLPGKLLNGLIEYTVELNTKATTVVAAPTAAANNAVATTFPADYPGGWIGFHTDRDGNYEVYVIDSKGQSVKNVTSDAGSYDWNVDFFPDGKRIAFVSNRATKDFQQVYVANIDFAAGKLSNIVQLTSDGANGHLAVSPDGSRIAFTSTRDAPVDVDTHNGELYVMDADGKNQTRLTNDPAKDGVPTWSSDGKRIAFMSNRKGNMDIWIIDLETKKLTQLTKEKSDEFEPAWSPDGKKIAFASDKDGVFDQNIYTVDVETGARTQLTKGQSINWYPQWSPDGKWLTFMTSRHGNWEVYSMRADGTDQFRLTAHPAFDRYPRWSRATKK